MHANRNQKKAEVATLISDEVNFKIKTVRRDKQGQYTMIKASIQEVLTIINIYVSNIGVPQYTRQMVVLLKKKLTVTSQYWGTLISHSHQWIKLPDKKLIRNHKL